MKTDEFYHLFANPSSLNETTLQELDDLVHEFPLFQAGWMLYLKNHGENQQTDNTLREGAIRVPDRKKLYLFLNGTSGEKAASVNYEITEWENLEIKEESTEDGAQGNLLIDKFLASEPGKIRPVPDNDNHAEEEDVFETANSDMENDGLITETLALIYFQQKKYDKALDAFRKLSLKYPEKSIYFAARIEEIEILKNI